VVPESADQGFAIARSNLGGIKSGSLKDWLVGPVIVLFGDRAFMESL
jgi:hypothetical protein